MRLRIWIPTTAVAGLLALTAAAPSLAAGSPPEGASVSEVHDHTGMGGSGDGHGNTAGMLRMHEQMMKNHPDMARMHERMMKNHPDMARMHEHMMIGDSAEMMPSSSPRNDEGEL